MYFLPVVCTLGVPGCLPEYEMFGTPAPQSLFDAKHALDGQDRGNQVPTYVGGCFFLITPPWAVFQARLLDNQEGAVPIPNDTSSESSRRDVSMIDLFGTGTIPTVVISIMEDRTKGV